jgi:oligopeptide/dipeptide ABC transporter ATP-binding protein
MSGAPLFEAADLRVGFPGDAGEPSARAVDGVSFVIAPGEILGIVGESGCGKTVTALAAMDLLPRGARVTAARLRLEGVDLLSLRPKARRALDGRRMAMVFQDPLGAFTPWLTIGAQVGEAVVRGGAARGRAAVRAATVALLRRVGLPDPEARLRAYPHELSGGSLQRCLLAMALAAGPALLWADEPTTALDATIQAQILDLLARLRDEEGLAIVLVTHDLGVVAGLADRVLVLYAGRVAEEAPAAALFARPQHPYTRALLAAVPRPDRPDERPRGIPGRPPRPTERPTGCPFAPRCPLAEERCAAASPPLTPRGPGHTAACWVTGG